MNTEYGLHFITFLKSKKSKKKVEFQDDFFWKKLKILKKTAFSEIRTRENGI